MKFIRLSNRYTNRNLLFLVLAALVPAALFTIFSNPLGIAEFFYDLFSDSINLKNAPFIDVYQYFSLVNFSNLLLWFVTFLSGVVFVGIVYSIIERKMKYGTTKSIGLRNLLRSSVLIVFPIAIILLALLQLVGLISTGLIFWMGRLFSGYLAKIICVVIVLAIYIVSAMYLSFLVCWIPCMTLDGLNFIDAISLSVRLCAEQQKKIFLTILTLFTVLHCVSFLFFIFVGGLGFQICQSIISLLLCMNVPVYINAVYFELAEVPRMDGRRRKN